MGQVVRVGIVGATGYTGAELVRILFRHPHAELTFLGGQSKAGEPVAKVLPNLHGLVDGVIEAFDPARVADRADVVFCALPHAASAPVVAELRGRSKIVFDLSADFRLSDPAVYERWYGPHPALHLLGEAVYGLVELYRDALRHADLIAVPGCYPTSAILAIAPLLHRRLVDPRRIIIDAKSGVSGAGRSPMASNLFAEASEGIRAYKVGGQHRHTPEIEQELSRLADESVNVTFTPHLVPMVRGILATCYLTVDGRARAAADYVEAARDFYADSPALTVLDADTYPDTHWTRGANRALLSYTVDDRTGCIIAQAAIDNLVKGAAGQAVQAFNVRMGLPEQTGLEGAGLWP